MRQELYRFVVPGRPVGYYAQGKCPNWKRKKAYEDYKRHVQKCALAQGAPGGRLIATKDKPIWIHTVAYFASGVHPDPENVRKAISDALFWRKLGRGCGDKFCGGGFEPPRYDKENPRVEVVIEEISNGPPRSNR